MIEPEVWFEIINPSDRCWINGQDKLAACVAVVVLARGQYALNDENGETVMPTFFCGGGLEWLKEQGIDDLNVWLDSEQHRLIAPLRSVTYGSLAEVKSQQLALNLIEDETKRNEFLAANEEMRRSSLSQIVLSARDYADAIEKKLAVKA